MSEAGEPNLLERLKRLRDEDQALAESMRARQDRVTGLLAQYLPVNPVTARATLREDGLLESLEIDSGDGEPSANEYLEAINSAILLAQAEKPSLPLPAAQALLAALREHRQPPSVSVSDDLKQLTVTASFGDIRAVEAKSHWLESSPDHVIAEEIVRIAQEAARKSDQYGRFS